VPGSSNCLGAALRLGRVIAYVAFNFVVVVVVVHAAAVVVIVIVVAVIVVVLFEFLVVVCNISKVLFNMLSVL
jgi:hypothetical protein